MRKSVHGTGGGGGPELEAQVAFEMRLLIQQYDFVERQIDAAEAELPVVGLGHVVQRPGR